MKKYISKSKQDTKKLAEKISRQLHGLPRRNSDKVRMKAGGEIIGLIGELGAGKTTFIQYLAKALGVKNTVNSPTFNIMKLYKTQHPKVKQLCHVDVYRLNSAKELTALGVQEYFERSDTVTVIEWADKVKKILPKDAMVINIKMKKGNERVFEINPAP